MDEDEKSACILEGWASALRQVSSLKKELADAQEQLRTAQHEVQQLKADKAAIRNLLDTFDGEVKLSETRYTSLSGEVLPNTRMDAIGHNITTVVLESRQLTEMQSEQNALRTENVDLRKELQKQKDELAHRNKLYADDQTKILDQQIEFERLRDACKNRAILLAAANKALKAASSSQAQEQYILGLRGSLARSQEELRNARATLHDLRIHEREHIALIQNLRATVHNTAGSLLSHSYHGPRSNVASGSGQTSRRNDIKHDSFDEVVIVSTNFEPTYASPLSAERTKIIEGLSPFVPRKDAHGSTFTKTFLARAIGGSPQPLIVGVADSATALARKHGISCYLCPNSDHNSWCPQQPGQHGYIFVGLGKEKDTFSTPEILNVFVGTKSPGQSKPHFKYLGIYRVSRVEALTVEEWLSLPLKIRETYSETTNMKTGHRRTVNDIHADYDAGRLHVPCVLLECVGFNKELYDALAASISPASVSRAAPSLYGKRRREDDDYEFDIPRRRSVRHSF